MFNFRKTNKTIQDIDSFFDKIDEGILVFKSGVKNYLYASDQFSKNLESMAKLEHSSSELRRSIESELYTHSLMAEVRGDVLSLLEYMEGVVRTMKRNLYQFDVEIPLIPVELNTDLLKLVDVSTSSVESVIFAAKAYFRSPQFITEQIHRVYFFEKESNNLGQHIKRRVFHNMEDLKLSEKFHLRYFTLHIEEIAHTAKKIADLLSIMAIKRNF